MIFKALFGNTTIHFDNLIILLLLGIVYISIMLVLKLRFKKSLAYLFFSTVMFIYVCGIIKMVLFPIYTLDAMREEFGGQNVWREMNLIPFKSMLTNFSLSGAQNILLMMPLGFGLPFIARSSFRKTAVVGFAAGLICELSQLGIALAVGFTFRFVDVDDVILNTAGALLGYTVFQFAFKPGYMFIITKYFNKDKDIGSFLGHIRDVCQTKTPNMPE